VELEPAAAGKRGERPLRLCILSAVRRGTLQGRNAEGSPRESTWKKLLPLNVKAFEDWKSGPQKRLPRARSRELGGAKKEGDLA